MHHPTDRIAHTTAFVTPVVEHWLEWDLAQWVHHEGLIRRPIAPWANALTTDLHIAPPLREYIPQWLKLNAQFPNFASHNTLINLAHNSIKMCLKLWTSSSPVTTLINWQNWFLSQTELIMLYVYFDILHTWNRHQKTYQFLENRYIRIPSLRHMTF